MSVDIEEDVKKITLEEYKVLNVSSDPLIGRILSQGQKSSKKGNKKTASKSTPEKFDTDVNIEIIDESPCGMDLEFDMIGCDAAVANALRRILISDLPSMAVEKVHIYNNTSLIQDEVLAHRLGLIPLNVDAALFDYKKVENNSASEDVCDDLSTSASRAKPGDVSTENSIEDWSDSHGDYGCSKDTLVFDLKVRCSKNPNCLTPSTSSDTEKFINCHVLSSHIKYVPPPSDVADCPSKRSFRAVHEDILIAKLRPGHEINVRMFAHKGVGSDHAKFSPVATAFYRLMPSIQLKKDFYGEDALLLKSCFSNNVIGLKDSRSGKIISDKNLDSVNKSYVVAYVNDARGDMCSRNCFRFKQFTSNNVELGKVANHFIFRVESVGGVKARDLVRRAWTLLQRKCDEFLLDCS